MSVSTRRKLARKKKSDNKGYPRRQAAEGAQQQKKTQELRKVGGNSVASLGVSRHLVINQFVICLPPRPRTVVSISVREIPKVEDQAPYKSQVSVRCFLLCSLGHEIVIGWGFTSEELFCSQAAILGEYFYSYKTHPRLCSRNIFPFR